MNDRQRRFVDEYLVDANATQAAIRAGYSARSAKVRGHRLVRRPDVAQAIKEAQAKLAKRAEVGAEQVLRELAVVGFSDMGHYLKFGADGEVWLDWTDMPENATRAIAEINQEVYTVGRGDRAHEVRRTKFKLHPKIPALEAIAEHLGMFNQAKSGEPEQPAAPVAIPEDVRRRLRLVIGGLGKEAKAPANDCPPPK